MTGQILKKEVKMKKDEALLILKKITEEGKDPYTIGESIPVTALRSEKDCENGYLKSKKLWTEYLAGQTRRCCRLEFCDGTSSEACTPWTPYNP
jgi:hypothetical protein